MYMYTPCVSFWSQQEEFHLGASKIMVEDVKTVVYEGIGFRKNSKWIQKIENKLENLIPLS